MVAMKCTNLIVGTSGQTLACACSFC